VLTTLFRLTGLRSAHDCVVESDCLLRGHDVYTNGPIEGAKGIVK
jgi:hypothetical protein